jgi:hypothetical protein
MALIDLAVAAGEGIIMSETPFMAQRRILRELKDKQSKAADTAPHVGAPVAKKKAKKKKVSKKTG